MDQFSDYDQAKMNVIYTAISQIAVKDRHVLFVDHAGCGIGGLLSS